MVTLSERIKTCGSLLLKAVPRTINLVRAIVLTSMLVPLEYQYSAVTSLLRMNRAAPLVQSDAAWTGAIFQTRPA
jgi:hypothetical protein